jgi:hypothetical protein
MLNKKRHSCFVLLFVFTFAAENLKADGLKWQVSSPNHRITKKNRASPSEASRNHLNF